MPFCTIDPSSIIFPLHHKTIEKYGRYKLKVDKGFTVGLFQEGEHQILRHKASLQIFLRLVFTLIIDQYYVRGAFKKGLLIYLKKKLLTTGS